MGSLGRNNKTYSCKTCRWNNRGTECENCRKCFSVDISGWESRKLTDVGGEKNHKGKLDNRYLKKYVNGTWAVRS